MNNYYDPFDCEITCEEIYDGMTIEEVSDDEWKPFRPSES